jgi:hypothetical protein
VKLQLERLQLDPEVTIGSLSVDGAWECWTLEDTVRAAGVKIYGKTAIPAGRYQIVVTHSPRFKRELPLLVNVPGFEGVRIHPGNTAADTEGCILVGQDRHSKSIGRSRVAFDQLFAKIVRARSRGEVVTLEVT